MNRFHVVQVFLALAAFVGGSGCVTGKVLTLPGDLARPEARGAAQTTAAGPAVAVLDFTFEGASSHEIGRDFDHARAIVWNGDPGKTMPDLIAGVLNEKGFRAVRVSSEAAVPADAIARVWGAVNKFRVETRLKGSLKMKVESAATVSLTVYATGGSAPPNWNSTVISDYWTEDALFVTPEGVRDALNGAANAVAEETVRRLVAAGIIPDRVSSPGPEKGGK
ncbi:MAG: hypothetical protein ACWGPR_01440 [Candidatus Deferrimicrobiaceae bacterium]